MEDRSSVRTGCPQWMVLARCRKVLTPIGALLLIVVFGMFIAFLQSGQHRLAYGVGLLVSSAMLLLCLQAVWRVEDRISCLSRADRERAIDYIHDLYDDRKRFGLYDEDQR